MPLPVHEAPLRGISPEARQNQDPLAGLFQDPDSLAGIFLDALRRDLVSFYPTSRLDRTRKLALVNDSQPILASGPSLDFRLDRDEEGTLAVSILGMSHQLSTPSGFGPRDYELIGAIGRVMELHFQVLQRRSRVSLLQLRRGMPEDHYVAAAVDPFAYHANATTPSRIAEVILTLRTMALSTYENRRVTTGAIITGLKQASGEPVDGKTDAAPPEPLAFGMELTSLKSIHRLCDGRRTLFLVDQEGMLAEIVDIRHWAISKAVENEGAEVPAALGVVDPEPVLAIPCPRLYTFHALATKTGGHACLVLSPNQEIKVFANGVQAFVFAHGRWRVLDPEAKFEKWRRAVADPVLARVLFQTALDLAEERQGGLIVVVSDPDQAIGELISPLDVIDASTPRDEASTGRQREVQPTLFSMPGTTSHHAEAVWREDPPHRLAGQPAQAATEPLSKRSLHYLARGKSVTTMDPTVLESLAKLDGALVTDPQGRIIAFGTILRHDAQAMAENHPTFPHPVAEGARTTAAHIASRYGPVLKISEDGIVSCFLNGVRAWDL